MCAERRMRAPRAPRAQTHRPQKHENPRAKSVEKAQHSTLSTPNKTRAGNRAENVQVRVRVPSFARSASSCKAPFGLLTPRHRLTLVLKSTKAKPLPMLVAASRTTRTASTASLPLCADVCSSGLPSMASGPVKNWISSSFCAGVHVNRPKRTARTSHGSHDAPRATARHWARRTKTQAERAAATLTVTMKCRLPQKSVRCGSYSEPASAPAASWPPAAFFLLGSVARSTCRWWPSTCDQAKQRTHADT